MLRFFISLLLCIGIGQALNAQDINEVEYFFDTDPGFGNGVAVNFTPSISLENVQFLASTSTLATGFHTFQVRSKDVNGKWSLNSNTAIYKDVLASSLIPNITQIEYFLILTQALVKQLRSQSFLV